MNDAEMIAETLRLDAEATCSPWCFMPPGDGNGDTRRWSVGESLEDDPPIALLVNWHEEQNARLIAFYRTAAPTLARRLEAVTRELEAVRAVALDGLNEIAEAPHGIGIPIDTEAANGWAMAFRAMQEIAARTRVTIATARQEKPPSSTTEMEKA